MPSCGHTAIHKYCLVIIIVFCFLYHTCKHLLVFEQVNLRLDMFVHCMSLIGGCSKDWLSRRFGISMCDANDKLRLTLCSDFWGSHKPLQDSPDAPHLLNRIKWDNLSMHRTNKDSLDSSLFHRILFRLFNLVKHHDMISWEPLLASLFIRHTDMVELHNEALWWSRSHNAFVQNSVHSLRDYGAIAECSYNFLNIFSLISSCDVFVNFFFFKWDNKS